MIRDALQQRVHAGDRDAFREVYGAYSREVYALAHTALGDAGNARDVVKQVFLSLYRELMHAEADIDLPARLSALVSEEVRIRRIAAGDLSPAALNVRCDMAELRQGASPDPMTRVRARMEQQGAAASPAYGPAPETDARPAAEPAYAAELSPEMEPASVPEPAQGAAAAAVTESAPAMEDASAPEAPRKKKKKGAAAADEVYDEAFQPKGRRRPGAVIAGILLVLLLIVFVWLLCGILMDLSVLPFYDLGYSFFNANVFPFFELG